jgi:hypothetical protein
MSVPKCALAGAALQGQVVRMSRGSAEGAVLIAVRVGTYLMWLARGLSGTKCIPIQLDHQDCACPLQSSINRNVPDKGTPRIPCQP